MASRQYELIYILPPETSEQQAGELHEQPRDGVRVSHHDLNLWEELAEVGIVDAQASQWVRAAQMPAPNALTRGL